MISWARSFVVVTVALASVPAWRRASAYNAAGATTVPARVRILARLGGSDASRSVRTVPLPDTAVAMGPWNLLSSADDMIRSATRDGAQPLDENGATLFADPSNAGPTVTLFDRLSSRALVASVSATGGETVVHLATNLTNQVLSLPDSGDLATTFGWCTYSFSLATLVVNPQIRVGAGVRWMVVTVRPEAVGPAVLVVLDKNRLLEYAESLDCPQITPKVFKLKDADRGIAPAVHYTRSHQRQPPTYLLSSEVNGDGAHEYVVWTISGGKKPKLRREILDAPMAYDAPPAMDQRGGAALSIGDGGMASVAFRDGHLWGAHSVACPERPDRACVRVLEVDAQASARLAASVKARTIVGSRKSSLAMPGIAVNKNRDVAVTFVQSRRNKFASFAAAILGRGESDFGRERTLVQGKCALRTGLRGAPSAAVQTDPADDSSFWVNAPSPIRVGGCSWSTQITHFARKELAAPPTEVLDGGTLALPSTTQFSGPGFNQAFQANAQMPADLAATRGARLVLRLWDQSRPGVACGSEHPLSGCATVDYSEPAATFANSVTVATDAGPRTYHLADNQLLTNQPIRRPG